MKKNGFTLIELLAVIVILAIIALIATPIVLNIIEDSKESSKLNSANHYIDALEQAIMRYNMSNGGNFIPKECEIQSNGNLKCDGKNIMVEVDGEKPISGTIVFESGKIVDIVLEYKDEYIGNNKVGNLVSGYKKYRNGQEVYFNVETGTGCSKEDYNESNSKTDYNGIDTRTEEQNGCLKFYAFNDDISSEKVNLLLDHNTSDMVIWHETDDFEDIAVNKNGPEYLLNGLYNSTKNWKGTIVPKDYIMDQSTQTSGAKYTVKYSEPPAGEIEPYKARLISVQEIAQITGADIDLKWDESTALETQRYYFYDLSQDSSTGSGEVCASAGCKYGWLYDRTGTTCKTYGCLNNSDVDGYMTSYGYWTISSTASSQYYAWRVAISGSIASNIITEYGLAGLRPVIEVLKSNLS